MPERTGPQTLRGPQIFETQFREPLARQSPRRYKTYRQMRTDPTIALARTLAIAPVLVSPWSFEHTAEAPAGASDFISKQLEPFRIHVLRTALLGNIDFGWQPYEKVFEVDAQGYVGLRKLKPLLQDITEILVLTDTGAFAGFRQYKNGREVNLELEESLLISFDVEGTDWYGQPTMEVARRPYDQWNTVEEAADRYDRKIAGAHWVVHYPRGKSRMNGTLTDNFEIARRLLRRLEASGGIAVPTKISKVIDDLTKQAPDAWKIEILADTSGGKGAFIDRQKYLDALKVRAFGLPERAVLEGQFGTKAEAEAHADLAIMNMEVKHRILAQLLNWHFVNQLLRMNYGDGTQNSVYIEPAAITDMDRLFLRQVFTGILSNQEGFAQVAEMIDHEALADRVGVPIKPEANIDAAGVVSDVLPSNDSGDSEAGEMADLLPISDVV